MPFSQKEINPHLFKGHFLLGNILPQIEFFVLTIKNTPKEWNDDEVNNLIEQINQFLTSLIGGINPTNLWYSGTPPCVHNCVTSPPCINMLRHFVIRTSTPSECQASASEGQKHDPSP